MKPKEYAQANKDWLAAKVQEEGIKPLPKGIIIRYWRREKVTESILRHVV